MEEAFYHWAQVAAAFGSVLIAFSVAGAGWIVRGRDKAAFEGRLQEQAKQTADRVDGMAAAIAKAKEDLVALRIEVSEKYVKHEALARTEERLLAAVGTVTTAIDKLSARIDQMIHHERG